MKKAILSIIVFLSISAYASEHHEEHESIHDEEAQTGQIVSQPTDCIAKKTLPCTFKSISRHASVISKTEFVFLKDAVVKVTDFTHFSLEPIVGGFIIKSSKEAISVKGVQLGKFPSYADTTKDQVEVIDGKDFYVYKFTEDVPEKYLLDREPFIKKLSGFYNSIEALKQDYKGISGIYNKTFKQDLAAHKKTLTRKIASIEEDKKLEAERQKRLRQQQLKNKETFFKRTFDQ